MTYQNLLKTMCIVLVVLAVLVKLVLRFLSHQIWIVISYVKLNNSLATAWSQVLLKVLNQNVR